MWGTLNPFPFFTGGSQPAPAQRYILTLNGVNSYIDAGGEITLSGDFSIELMLNVPSLTHDMAIVDSTTFSSTTNHTLIYLDNPDGLQFLINTGGDGVFDRFIFGGVSQLIGTGYNKLRIYRVGNTLKASVNDADLVNTFTISNSEVIISGRFFGGFTRFLAGSAHNLKINDGSVYNYPIDDNSTTVIRNTATVLGPEMFNNPALGVWLDNGDGSYTLNGDGSYQPLGQIALNSNDTYLVEITVDSLVGGTLSAYNQAAHRSLDVGKNVLLITGGSRFDIVRLNGTITATVRDISIKKANGYATPINVTPSMWSLINV